MRVLGIETSCDETAAAVVDDGPAIVSNAVHSQIDVHARFGGVVPEVASREHTVRIVPVVEQALAEAGGAVDAVAVSAGPGLVGALLVGMQFAKGFALGRGLPWVAVNHLEGHLAAALLAEAPPAYPHVALLVSGGHTLLYHVRAFADYRLLGGTRDDAAGEAFDKIAKVLGLGYPGGVAIERTAKDGDPSAIELPRALPQRASLDFSFSGLKTAVATRLKSSGVPQGEELRDFCASAQEAIVDVLVKKAIRAARSVDAPGIVLAGGVAANTRLRDRLAECCSEKGLWSFAPPKPLCTDNAAMVAAAGWMRLRAGECSDWLVTARSRWPLGDVSSVNDLVKPRRSGMRS